MNLRKLLLVVFVIAALLTANQVGFASDLPQLGLVCLHEYIPGLPMAEPLYSSSYDLPSAVDLSGKFPPVGNQGLVGSCVAFATGYAEKTYQEGLDWKWDIRVNGHIFSPAYIYNQIHINNTASGGGSYFSSAFKLLQSQGCTTLDDMPYNGNNYGWQTQPTAQQKVNAALHKAASWAQLPSGNYNEIKAQLSAGNPVVVGLPVYPDFDNLNANNPIYDTLSGSSRGNHAVCVVGYDDAKSAVKIINSWGQSWGISGYGWISYNLIQNINMEAYVMTDRADAKIMLKYDFDGDYYLSKYPDLRTAFGTDASAGYNHWLTYGVKEGRRAAMWFDPVYYLAKYPDLLKAFGSGNYTAARQHWLDFGIREGRQGSPDFWVVSYLNRYPDLQKAFGTDYLATFNHWLTFGINEGRTGKP